jgi:hypothetical protein
MNAKTKIALRALAALLLASAALFLAGCAPASESMRDVIEDFIAGVNDQDIGDIKDRLDDDAADYNTASTLEFWDVYFTPGNAPFEITAFDKSGDSATVTFTGSAGGDFTYYFEMTEKKGTMTEGGTFYIRRIRQNNSSGSVIFE